MDQYICVSADLIDSTNTAKVSDMIEPHSHDYFEIYYFIGDSMTFFMDSAPTTLYAHDIILVNRHMFHKTQYNPYLKNARANISFNSGFLYRYFDVKSIDKILKMFDTPLLVNKDGEFKESISSLVDSICSNINKSSEYSVMLGYHYICVLLLSFLQNSESFQAMPSIDKLPQEQSRISQIARYINEHYSENITLTSLANEFYVSKYFLSHSFKETTGVNITGFINNKRVSEAANLLENTSMPLTEIAMSVGFNNQPYFIKTFKKYHGMSPSKYREMKWKLKEYCERFTV
ncbi:MAG: AraC family transcriptional regulator [Clostridiales bacterium]|jgi:AraC-like DNA-binding protein|nr:AraC family transcriptional regulator [Clostridiales bacterium]MDR2750612.1 AraC family transcriptional regulator [Clostridiales bacterium]